MKKSDTGIKCPTISKGRNKKTKKISHNSPFILPNMPGPRPWPGGTNPRSGTTSRSGITSPRRPSSRTRRPVTAPTDWWTSSVW